MKITYICEKCLDNKYTTRYVSTSRTTGILKLRYSPRTPYSCTCIKTEKDNES